MENDGLTLSVGCIRVAVLNDRAVAILASNDGRMGYNYSASPSLMMMATLGAKH